MGAGEDGKSRGPGAHGRVRILCIEGKVRVWRSLATSTLLGECPVLAGSRALPGLDDPGSPRPWPCLYRYMIQYVG